jgi:hypothetical protein
MHDLVAAETSWRADLAHGIDFISKRLGLDPAAVVNHWLQNYSDPNWQRVNQERIEAHEVNPLIKKYESHPKNVHMRDPAARQWMSQ